LAVVAALVPPLLGRQPRLVAKNVPIEEQLTFAGGDHRLDDTRIGFVEARELVRE
jgi:hypothetical protein